MVKNKSEGEEENTHPPQKKKERKREREREPSLPLIKRRSPPPPPPRENMEEQDAEVSVPANDPRAASASVVLEEVGAPSNVEKKYAESELKHQSEEETKKRGRKRKEAEKESDEEKMASETTTKSTPSADREKIFHVFVKTLNGKTITLPLKWIGNTLEGLKFDDTNVKEEEEEEEEEEIKGLEHVRYQELENLNDPKFDVRALLSNVLALRMKEREGWSRKFTKGLCQELFHFLELKATLGDFEGCEFSPPTSLMDDLWHEVILNTKLYRRLCATLPNNPGGKLIDHTTFGAVDLEVQRARTREKLT